MNKLLLCAVACCMVVASSAAFADWTENFDSYADQAAFNAVWTGTTPMTLVTDQAASLPNSIYQSASQLSWRPVGNDIPTASLYFKCSFYDNGAALGRTFAAVQAKAGGVYTGALSQLVAIGKNNGMATSKYSARVAFNSSNWFNLDGAANRSVGWHTAEIVGKSNGTVEFLIDGVVGGSAPCANTGFNIVALGSGLSTSTAMYYDDVTIAAVPEPGSLLALGTGLIGLVGLRRRK